MLVPGCASNAYTFDTAPGYSLARHLATCGHDTWIVECRGVGFSRPWRREGDWSGDTLSIKYTQIPKLFV